MKVRFTADYDHRWPSRAITAFKADYEGTVKREVGETAIAKGKATEVSARATPASDAGKVSGRSNAVGGGDIGSLAPKRARGIRGGTGRDGDGESPAVPGTVNPSDAQ